MEKYPLWSVVPFVGMLLSIALIPLVSGSWWGKNIQKVSAFWAMLFFVPAVLWGDYSMAFYQTLHIMLLDYAPFLILVASLFIIAGGVHINGHIPHTPSANTLMLMGGAVLASLVGTTGATMLTIRPILRANQARRHTKHTIVFLIFLVANIGGALTPVGDPPLFIGYLHGIPFFWTFNALAPWITSVGLLLLCYFLLDTYFYKKHLCEISGQRAAVAPMESCKHVNDGSQDVKKQKIGIEGAKNLLFLAGVLAAIIGSGVLAAHPLFFDANASGIRVFEYAGHSITIPYLNLWRDGIIALMAWLSWRFTPAAVRIKNNFTWGPIEEVAVLFAGIFITIIPALSLLQSRGSELGVSSAVQFFWMSGALSSFLDNTPTYLAFLSLAGQMGSIAGITTDLGVVNEEVLLAISCGSVFMGANTYIGNAPNFMAKSIAEEHGVAMPGFFAYMLWAIVFLLPVFYLNVRLYFA